MQSVNARWQIRTKNRLTGDVLHTTEMPQLLMAMRGLPRYESCMFRAEGSSDVLDRYTTRDQARQGHALLVEQLLNSH